MTTCRSCCPPCSPKSSTAAWPCASSPIRSSASQRDARQPADRPRPTGDRRRPAAGAPKASFISRSTRSTARPTARICSRRLERNPRRGARRRRRLDADGGAPARGDRRLCNRCRRRSRWTSWRSSIQFLHWLADGHFTFLGLREYDFLSMRRGPAASANRSRTAGLGLLRDADLHVLRRTGSDDGDEPDRAGILQRAGAAASSPRPISFRRSSAASMSIPSASSSIRERAR